MKLGHTALVDRRRVLFHAGRNLFAGLVKAARAGGSICCSRAALLPRESSPGLELTTMRAETTAQYGALLRWGASPGVDADRVGGVVRASLSPRRAALAALDCLRPADTGLGPQFPFTPEHQLPGNHESATPFVVGRRDGLGAGRP